MLSTNQNKRHIILIGYRGTGKSTIGSLLKKKLGLPLFDSDREIEKTEKRSIPEIFKESGEDKFRQLEEKCILNLCSTINPIVISTGGGAVLSAKNREILKDKGFVFLLSADEKTIYDRISNDSNRPSLTDLSLKDEIRSVLEFRMPLYKECMDFEISTIKKSPEEICNSILDQLNNYLPALKKNRK